MKTMVAAVRWIGALLAATLAHAGTNSWTPIGPSQGDSSQYLQLEADPSNASVLYLAAPDTNPSTYTAFLGKSSNRGATWAPPSFFADGEIAQVAIAPSNSAVIYVVLFNPGDLGVVYRSSDGGATWNLRNAGLIKTVLALAIDPNDADTAYAATVDGIFKTTNGGVTWPNVRPGDGRYIYTLLADPTTSGRVYANSLGVLARTFDGGATWDTITMPASFTLAIDPDSPSTLYSGPGSLLVYPQSGTVYRSTDYGATWTAMATRGVPTDLAIDFLAVVPGTGGTLFLHKPCYGMFQSIDQGVTFRSANQGLPATPSGSCSGVLTPSSQMAISPAAPRKVLAMSYSIPAGDGLYEFESDASALTPICSLSASPTTIAAGGSSTLSAYCSPAAASYVWSANTGFASNASGGTVAPSQTTTYTVQGVNANGASNVASVTVFAPGPRLANLSTRARVQTGTSVVIGGFIVGGSTQKTVVIRATGPSLAAFGVADPLLDPTLQVFRNGVPAATNDDWQSASNASALQATGLAPNHPKEAALMLTLDPDVAYTVVVQGVNSTTGVGSVEVFEVDHQETPLINLSTRANVLTGEDVMIAGFVVQGNGSKTVVVNVAGPSLTSYFPASELLANPKLTLVRSSDGAIVATNDDWTQSADAAAIQASGFAPNNPLEPAIIATLPPGGYTAIVEGVNGGTGKAVVGAFAVP